MAKNERQTARKPATKYPNLRKKLQKGKIQSKQVKKKRGRKPALMQDRPEPGFPLAIRSIIFQDVFSFVLSPTTTGAANFSDLLGSATTLSKHKQICDGGYITAQGDSSLDSPSIQDMPNILPFLCRSNSFALFP